MNSGDDSEGWRDYEQRAFDVFRSTGRHCERGVVLSGARASHQIDVVVHLGVGSGRHRWLVECKQWSRRVGKRELQAFKATIDDVGADHGYLLSEAGFQSGAVRMAQTLNISLCSLEKLRERFALEQLLPEHQQSRAFKAVVHELEDSGNFDGGVTVELCPTGNVSVADHLIEVHVLCEQHWIIPADLCRKLVTHLGSLHLTLPWQLPLLCGEELEERRLQGGGSIFTGKTRSGVPLSGTYRIVFRTLAGPVSVDATVPLFK